jgi:outer membrane protein
MLSRLQLRKASAHFLTALVFISGSLLSSTAFSQFKIGYVNANLLLEKAPQAESAWTKLEQEFKPRDQSLQAKKQKLRDLENEVSQLKIGTSSTDRSALERQIRQEQRELKRLEEDFRDDFNARRNEELLALQALIQQVIKSIQQDEKYTLILNQDAVAAASEKADVTPLILRRLAEINQ